MSRWFVQTFPIRTLINPIIVPTRPTRSMCRSSASRMMAMNSVSNCCASVYLAVWWGGSVGLVGVGWVGWVGWGRLMA